jgi:hypothetical protein
MAVTSCRRRRFKLLVEPIRPRNPQYLHLSNNKRGEKMNICKRKEKQIIIVRVMTVVVVVSFLLVTFTVIIVIRWDKNNFAYGSNYINSGNDEA